MVSQTGVYDRSGGTRCHIWIRVNSIGIWQFDVSITLPSNYIVAATATCRMNRKRNILICFLQILPDGTTHYGEADFPPSSIQMKTLRYTEDKIHDFAWFADKRFHVQRNSKASGLWQGDIYMGDVH